MNIDFNTLSKLIAKPFMCEIDGKRILVDSDSCTEDLVPKYGYRVAEVQHEEDMVLLSIEKTTSGAPRFNENDAWAKEQFPNGDVTFF